MDVMELWHRLEATYDRMNPKPSMSRDEWVEDAFRASTIEREGRWYG